MKSVITLAATLLLTSATDPLWKQEFTLEQFEAMDAPSVFQTWSLAFNKEYATETELLERFQIWLENAKLIGDHNAKDSSYKLRFNQFGDLTADDFKMAIHGHTGSCFKKGTQKTPIKITDPVNDFNDVPASVDWTTKGVVTPVKNQGQCGSCWSFSATGATECQYAIKNGDLVSLSEQQLVDCSDAYGNEGCNGGFMEEAFRYIKNEGGLCSEASYPYKAKNGECKASSCGTLYDDITGFTAVTADSESSLQAAAAEGCVSVAVEADQTAFQFYSSGILDGNCGTSTDHGVLVVGYGTQGGEDYWKVKNSWGESWGEKGYLLICRNCNKNHGEGECGILTSPSFPLAASK